MQVESQDPETILSSSNCKHWTLPLCPVSVLTCRPERMSKTLYTSPESKWQQFLCSVSLTLFLCFEFHTQFSFGHTADRVLLSTEAIEREKTNSFEPMSFSLVVLLTGSLLSLGIGAVFPGLCGWSASRHPANTRHLTPSGLGCRVCNSEALYPFHYCIIPGSGGQSDGPVLLV